MQATKAIWSEPLETWLEVLANSTRGKQRVGILRGMEDPGLLVLVDLNDLPFRVNLSKIPPSQILIIRNQDANTSP